MNAGGRPHGSPALRNEENGCFNAAVLDFDGNSVEVICREVSGSQSDTAGASRVLTYGDPVMEELSNSRGLSSDAVKSIAMSALAHPRVGQTTGPAQDVVPAAPTSLPRSQSTPIRKTAGATATATAGTGTNTMIGTILGAAAGAAVAYTMCKSEEDSARAEFNFIKRVQAKAQGQPPYLKDDRQMFGTASKVSYQEANRIPSFRSSSYGRPPKMIEAPHANTYKHPTYMSVIDSTVKDEQAIEYIPAPVVEGRSLHNTSTYGRPKSHFAEQRQYPTDIQTLHTFASKENRPAASQIITTAKSNRANKAYHGFSSKSSAQEPKGSLTSHSKYDEGNLRQSQVMASKSKTPFNESKLREADKPKALISTRLPTSSSVNIQGSNVSRVSKATESGKLKSSLGISSNNHVQETAVDIDDQNTVMPSDSISCAPSPVIASASSSSRQDRSKTSKSKTEGSKRSKASRAMEVGRSKKATGSAVASEAGSVSTVRPAKRESVVSLPVRGTTERSSERVRGKRSVASYA